MYFQRFTPDDPEEFLVSIEGVRLELVEARSAGDVARLLDLVPDLGSMLTTARQEDEARRLLLKFLPLAREQNTPENLGWLLLALATANQYLDRRSEAGEQFAETLALAQTIHSEHLEHYTLHHWGRFLVEEGNIEQAKKCFTRALELRVKLDEPRQESTRRAIEALKDFTAAA